MKAITVTMIVTFSLLLCGLAAAENTVRQNGAVSTSSGGLLQVSSAIDAINYAYIFGDDNDVTQGELSEVRIAERSGSAGPIVQQVTNTVIVNGDGNTITQKNDREAYNYATNGRITQILSNYADVNGDYNEVTQYNRAFAWTMDTSANSVIYQTATNLAFVGSDSSDSNHNHMYQTNCAGAEIDVLGSGNSITQDLTNEGRQDGTNNWLYQDNILPFEAYDPSFNPDLYNPDVDGYRSSTYIDGIIVANDNLIAQTQKNSNKQVGEHDQAWQRNYAIANIVNDYNNIVEQEQTNEGFQFGDENILDQGAPSNPRYSNFAIANVDLSSTYKVKQTQESSSTQDGDYNEAYQGNTIGATDIYNCGIYAPDLSISNTLHQSQSDSGNQWGDENLLTQTNALVDYIHDSERSYVVADQQNSGDQSGDRNEIIQDESASIWLRWSLDKVPQDGASDRVEQYQSNDGRQNAPGNYLSQDNDVTFSNIQDWNAVGYYDTVIGIEDYSKQTQSNYADMGFFGGTADTDNSVTQNNIGETVMWGRWDKATLDASNSVNLDANGVVLTQKNDLEAHTDTTKDTDADKLEMTYENLAWIMGDSTAVIPEQTQSNDKSYSQPAGVKRISLLKYTNPLTIEEVGS